MLTLYKKSILIFSVRTVYEVIYTFICGYIRCPRCCISVYNNQRTEAVCVVSFSICFAFLDQIDENLRTAIQKDLNVMAPGLSVQV